MSQASMEPAGAHLLRVRRRARVTAAGPERRRVHRPFRHAGRADGPGPGHPQGCQADRRRARRDGAHARRGARRRLHRHVLAATAFRQARRRGLPVPHPALDVRDHARSVAGSTRSCAAAAGRCRPDPTSGRPQTIVSRQSSSIGLFRQAAQDQPAVRRRHQGDPGVIARACGRWRGSSTGSAATSGGSTCRCRSRCTPTASTWWSSRSSDPARRHCTSGRAGAQRTAARRGLPPAVPQGLRQQVRAAGLAPRLLRRRDRRLPRRVGGRQVLRSGRSRARWPASGRRLPRPGARARHGDPLAHHDLQPPPAGAQQLAVRTRSPDGLLRRGRAPAQHGVLQLRAAPAAACARRRAGGPPFMSHRAGGAPAHRRAGGLVSAWTPVICGSATGPTWW